MQANDRLPLFPLSRGLFPEGLLSLKIFEIRYLDMVKKALREKSPFVVVQLREGQEVNQPGETASFYETGTLAHISWADAPQPALFLIQARGGQRVQLADARQEKYGLWTAQAEILPEDVPTDMPGSLVDLANQLGRVIRELQQQGITEDQMPIGAPYRLDEAGWVANRWTEILPLSADQRQQQLEEQDPLIRLQRVEDWMAPLL